MGIMGKDMKLDLIYEKLLDLEIMFNNLELEKEKHEKESQKRDIEYRIEDIKYMREKQLENKAELMSIFRNIDKDMEYMRSDTNVKS